MTLARTTASALALLVPLIPLSGCSTTSTRDPQTPTSPSQAAISQNAETLTGGFTIRHADWQEVGYRWDWTGFPSLQPRERVTDFDVYDDIIVIQGSSSAVTIMETLTGRNRWVDRPASGLTRFVGSARDGNTLYLCAESEVFIIDLTNGNWIKRQPFEEVVNTKPMILEGGTLVFGTPTGNLFAHRTDFGVRAWRYGFGSPIVVNLVNVQGYIGAIARSGQVLFVDPVSAAGFGRPAAGDGSVTTPLTDGQNMYVASTDQSVYAFTVGNDRHLWRFRTNEQLTVQPTLHDGTLYVTIPGSGLVALDAASGSERWLGPDAQGQVVSIRAGSLIVWDGTTIKSVDPNNGDVIHAFSAPGLTNIVADRFVDGSLFGVTRQNAVIRLSPR